MSDFYCLHDKAVIEAFLRKQTDLHLYELGDLDDFFWPRTLWFANGRGCEISALCLVYVGLSLPTVLAFGDPAPLIALIKSVSDLLPNWFYAHVSPGVEAAFGGTFRLDPHGKHLKMSMKVPLRILGAEGSCAVRLGPEHLAEILQLYQESYPGNWFDPRMLDTREYLGIRDGSRLVCIAGIHAVSQVSRVATLGNITTLPSHRKKGLATIAIRELCLALLKKVDHIGLNVAADNLAAIACYRKLGFEVVASYLEFGVQKIRG
ncbi:MAG TPA: GNAT family N-acetyltransferase [Candidatus Ozemobacteraceae bacterium]|nr:GNAT family N-acetyltransferase [Candidatus Ozemobacteraceae bacterium]